MKLSKERWFSRALLHHADAEDEARCACTICKFLDGDRDQKSCLNVISVLDLKIAGYEAMISGLKAGLRRKPGNADKIDPEDEANERTRQINEQT